MRSGLGLRTTEDKRWDMVVSTIGRTPMSKEAASSMSSSERKIMRSLDSMEARFTASKKLSVEDLAALPSEVVWEMSAREKAQFTKKAEG